MKRKFTPLLQQLFAEQGVTARIQQRHHRKFLILGLTSLGRFHNASVTPDGQVRPLQPPVRWQRILSCIRSEYPLAKLHRSSDSSAVIELENFWAILSE